MLEKERGWVLSIDQASNNAGVSLWYNGKLIATTVLKSQRASDPIGKRMVDQIVQLHAFLEREVYVGDRVSHVLFEGVRSRLVLITIGAFLTCAKLTHLKISPRHTFVESTSWKYWARKHGASGPIKDIKGVKALLECGMPTNIYERELTEDEADSILIYCAWRDKR